MFFKIKNIISFAILSCILAIPFSIQAMIHVGVAKQEITPAIGTPSAGYAERKGEGMTGIHDPLYAKALFIDNGVKKIALCSVDHLGFTYEMVQEIIARVHKNLNCKDCEIYIGSSHTHSGGGAYLNIPVLGKMLAGSYDPKIVDFYIEQTTKAILQASEKTILAKIGIGYGILNENIAKYSGVYPEDVTPLSNFTIIKVTTIENKPLAILFNFPLHPTILKSQNRLFSADFVGFARNHLQETLGDGCEAIYFNGAQGDIQPAIQGSEDPFSSCSQVGNSLAEALETVWKETTVNEHLDIATKKLSYAFTPQPTPDGLTLSIDQYKSEMNLILLNQTDAFITIPGELSTLYDRQLKEIGKSLGLNVSIFGLTNDAHGYMILKESWKAKTPQSKLSFGGENYGDEVKARAVELLKATSLDPVN